MSEDREPLRGLPSAHASEDQVIRMHRFQAAWPELDFVPPGKDGSPLWVCLRDGQRVAAPLLLAHLLDDIATLMAVSRREPTARGPAVTAARVLTVHQPYAWALVAGVKTTEERAWTTSYRGQVLVYADQVTDPDAPAELWPPDGQMVASAVLGWVTLARMDGIPGRYLWRVTRPHQLAEPVTGVRGWPGLWLWHPPPELR